MEEMKSVKNSPLYNDNNGGDSTFDVTEVNHRTARTTNDDANEIDCGDKKVPTGLKFGEAITVRPGDRSKPSENGGTVEMHSFDMNFKAKAASTPPLKRSSYNPPERDTEEMKEREY